MANLAVGQQWPQGDEDKLLALGRAWEEAAQELVAPDSQMGPSVNGVLESVAGRVAEAFRDNVEQVLASLAQMAGSAHQLAELATTTGVEIEYAKYMIIVQLVWMAAEIGQWVLFAPEAVPAIVAAGRAAVQMILRRLMMSIAAGVGVTVGLDAAVQALQMLKDDRTRWNVYNTLQAAESGAVGGAIGGLTFGGPGVLTPRFAESLVGKLALGAVTGVVTTEAMYAVFGGESGIASAFTSGALGAISGGGRRVRRLGGDAVEIDPVPPRLPDDNNSAEAGLRVRV
ncbi:hypothetical protein [Streptomyces sp. NPDC006668]|uniref:WXG100-like domain-containing protein n=1 Tax=Streptomyces sp. NPDC006668 TaxID=3156903 RepID=UPI0033E68B2B